VTPANPKKLRRGSVANPYEFYLEAAPQGNPAITAFSGAFGQIRRFYLLFKYNNVILYA
jgi:hypothetical protein